MNHEIQQESQQTQKQNPSGQVQHTPGPWSVSQDYSDDITDRSGRLIANAYYLGDSDEEHSEELANARLIAATPEMAGALLSLRTELLDKIDGDSRLDVWLSDRIRAIEAVLVKAGLL